MQKKSRNILIAVFVLAVVAIAVISWFASKSGHQEEDLYALAMAKLAQTNTASLRVELDTFIEPSKLTGSEEGSLNSMDIPLGVNGPVSLSYPVGGLVTGQAELNFSAGLGLMKLMKLNLMLAEDGQLYSKVEDLPDDTGLPANLSGLNDTWFSFAGQDLTKLLPWLTEAANQPEFGLAVPISADRLRAAIGGWLVPQRQYEDTIIANQSAAHYELLVDRQGLSKFLFELTAALRGRPCSVDEQLAIAQQVDAQRLLAEAWVSQATGNLLMFKLGVFPQGETAGMPVALTLAFSEFDRPVALDLPSEALPLSTMLDNFPGVTATQ